MSKCDQVIGLSGKVLLDVNDYTKSQEAYFTMNAFFINEYMNKDSSTLRNSIIVETITSLPTILEGSSCVEFDSPNKKLYMCPTDRPTAEKIIQVYASIVRCRQGETLGKLSLTELLATLKKSCLGLDIEVDLSKYGNDEELAKKELMNAYQAAFQRTIERLPNAKIALHQPPKVVPIPVPGTETQTAAAAA
jgi:hypothetical protein